MLALASCHAESSATDAATDAIDETADANDGACAPQPLDVIDDAQVDCSTFVALPCGLPDAAQVSECYPDLETCFEACRTNELFYCVLTPNLCTIEAGMIATDAQTTLECVSCLGGGRRPRGMVAPRARGEFARLAHVEAASVRAFRDLERALVAFRAPTRLVRAARRARADETRHARAMRRIARRFGERVECARVKRAPAPTLVELLVDDAIEGCVNETVGAAMLEVRGARARDARVRRTLARTARDEANHAALAWEILRWGLPLISPRDRAVVRAALESAFRALERAENRERDPAPRAIARHLRVATARLVAW